jgi:hypothetical protein
MRVGGVKNAVATASEAVRICSVFIMVDLALRWCGEIGLLLSV